MWLLLAERTKTVDMSERTKRNQSKRQFWLLECNSDMNLEVECRVLTPGQLLRRHSWNGSLHYSATVFTAHLSPLKLLPDNFFSVLMLMQSLTYWCPSKPTSCIKFCKMGFTQVMTGPINRFGGEEHTDYWTKCNQHDCNWLSLIKPGWK